ncbi:hypothetical protein [Shimia biformata]|nr:hypothetical protein [Shimia biformata]
MKNASLVLALLVLAACDPASQPVQPAPKEQPKSGVTISGSARVGVVYNG